MNSYSCVVKRPRMNTVRCSLYSISVNLMPETLYERESALHGDWCNL